MTAERKIGANSYRVKAPKATVALPLFFRLGKVLGPGFDSLVSALLRRGQDGEQDIGARMILAVADILGAADPDAATAVIGEIVGLAEIRRTDYERAHLDEIPADELVPVAAFALQEVFGPFVGSAMSALGVEGAD